MKMKQQPNRNEHTFYRVLGIALRYQDALKKIAFQPKIESMGYGCEDNSFEVETAREALCLPLDLPEFDDQNYKEKEENESNS